MHIPKGLAPYFKIIALLGIAAMIVDTKMSAEFGATIDGTAMFALAIVSVGSGFLLVMAEFFRRIGWRPVAAAAAGAWALAFVFNVWSNVGVATANRMGEVQTANVEQTNWAERKKASEEAEARLGIFTTQLEKLTAENAWAATVSADGLRQQVADLRVSRDSESKLGGCGRKCRAIENQISDVSGRIAVAEQRDDLTKRIEATKAVLAKARDDLAGTKAGISATANASTLHAKLVSWNLAAAPGNDAVTVANEGTGIGMAAVIAIMSAVLTFIGALPHLVGVTPMSAMPEPMRPVTPASWGHPEPQSAPEKSYAAQFGTLGDLIAKGTRDINLRVTHSSVRPEFEQALRDRGLVAG